MTGIPIIEYSKIIITKIPQKIFRIRRLRNYRDLLTIMPIIKILKVNANFSEFVKYNSVVPDHSTARKTMRELVIFFMGKPR